MKKVTQILTAMLLAVLATPAMAAIEGFVTEDSDKSIIHNGVTSSEGKNQTPGSNDYTGDIVIPEGVTTLKNKRVSNTDVGTFQYSTITSCHISSTVTDIQQGAFSDCPLLMSITVDENNEKYMSIEGCVYEYKTVNGEKVPTTLVFVPGGKQIVNIDERITKIADCAMDGCVNVKEITIPAGVTEIGHYAFTGCRFDKITCLAGTPPEVSDDYWYGDGWGFSDMTATEVFVLDVGVYDDHQDWKELNLKKFVPKSLEINATVSLVKENDEVVAIEQIQVTGKNGEVFAAVPSGWTLKYENGTTYTLDLSLSTDNKTVIVNVTEKPSNEGVYTLYIPAGSLVTTDGVKCAETTRAWTIQAPEYIYNNTVYTGVVLKMYDTDESFSLKYEKYDGTPVEITESHQIGEVLYSRTETKQSGKQITVTPYTYYSAAAEYIRTFTNNNWQAICVPFNLKYAETWDNLFEVSEIKSVTDYYDADNNVVWFYVIVDILGTDGVSTTVVPANTPCLIRSKHNGGTIERTFTIGDGETISADTEGIAVETSNGSIYNFTGNYKKQRVGDIAVDCTSVYSMSGGSIKYANNENVSLKTYRWFLTIDKANAMQEGVTYKYGKYNGDTTDLPQVKVQVVEADVYYDLNGRRVENPTSGIYIKNGKKVFVK